MEIRVLGSVELVGAQGPVPLHADKQRRLLAALVVRTGHAVPCDGLIEAVWGVAPPATAGKVVQVYVSQLRKLLAAPVAIRTQAGAYVLELGAAAVDAGRFERDVVDGMAASAVGNHALASSLLARGLGLWRGPAYGELAYEEFARVEAERLEELRLIALEEWFAAEIALGRHRRRLAEVCSLAHAQPLRERAQALAMLALYRCGRQADALEVYAATHVRLRDELGLDPGVELRELQRRILRQDRELSGVESMPAASSSLPIAPNALLGREREVAELRELLLRDDVRLLVLAGAGGSGKTRLALETARALAESFANGVVFVALAPLRDPAVMVGTIARSCGLTDLVGADQLGALAAALGGREVLLVLDNFEHIRSAAPHVATLLAAAPRLTVMVTSRAVLHLSGERVYTVAPLATKAASELFCARALEADHRFDPDAESREAIGLICERLDGLPLAIELAAARTNVLAPEQLLARLDPRLPLLTGGLHDLPARQQTLRATLEWSHDLLSDVEQRLFRRLSVFAGGFELTAVEEVCDGDLNTLASLVGQSLVHRSPGGRLGMLETIREFAADRLDASGETLISRARHAEYCLALSRSANLLEESEGEQQLGLVVADHQNIRVALGWTLASGEIDLGLELATLLETFWCAHAPVEGAHWLERFLARAEDVAPDRRARALRAYGITAIWTGDPGRAEVLYEQSLGIYRELGDERGIGNALLALAGNARDRWELRRARELTEQSINTLARAGSRLEQSAALAILGKIECDDGNHDLGIELLERAAATAGEHGSWYWQAWWLGELAEQAIELGRPSAGEAWGREALAVCRRTDDRQTSLFLLSLMARIALQDERPERAGRLWGAVETDEQTAPVGWWLLPDPPDNRFSRDRSISPLLNCRDPTFARGRDEGRRMSLDDAISFALGGDGADMLAKSGLARGRKPLPGA